MTNIRRIYGTETLVIPSGSSLTTEPLNMQRVAGGVIEMDSGWTTAGIAFKVSSGSVAANALPLYDENVTLVQITSPSVSLAIEIPVEVYGCQNVWLWSQSSGTSVDQSASRSLTIQTKS